MVIPKNQDNRCYICDNRHSPYNQLVWLSDRAEYVCCKCLYSTREEERGLFDGYGDDESHFDYPL